MKALESMLAKVLYRIIEAIDGERGLHIINYHLGEKIKLFLLIYIG